MIEYGTTGPGDPGGCCSGSTGGQTGALAALAVALLVLRRRRPGLVARNRG